MQHFNFNHPHFNFGTTASIVNKQTSLMQILHFHWVSFACQKHKKAIVPQIQPERNAFRVFEQH